MKIVVVVAATINAGVVVVSDAVIDAVVVATASGIVYTCNMTSTKRVYLVCMSVCV